jgi:hypothetical protein
MAVGVLYSMASAALPDKPLQAIGVDQPALADFGGAQTPLSNQLIEASLAKGRNAGGSIKIVCKWLWL